MQLRAKVLGLLDRGLDCLFVDESCFTWRGYSRKTWAQKYRNLELSEMPG